MLDAAMTDLIFGIIEIFLSSVEGIFIPFTSLFATVLMYKLIWEKNNKDLPSYIILIGLIIYDQFALLFLASYVSSAFPVLAQYVDSDISRRIAFVTRTVGMMTVLLGITLKIRAMSRKRSYVR